MSTPYALRNYSGAAVQTTIVGGITNASSTFVVADGSSFSASNFFCVIDEGTALEEKVFVGARSGNTFSSVTRGEDGPAAQAHAPGATIRHCYVAQDAAEANAFTAVQTTKGDTIERGAGAGPLRLAVGADETVYTASSAAASGKKWAVPGVSAVMTTAARNALAGANLFRGRRIFNSDTGADETYYGATTLWQPPWNTAWGEVVKTTSASVGSTVAGVEIDLMTATFTAVANRRYKISFYLLGFVSAATVNTYVHITDNTPTVLQEDAKTVTSTFNFSSFCFVEVNPPAGSVTYRGRMLSTSGTITLRGSATSLHYLLVEDIGANGNAPAS